MFLTKAILIMRISGCLLPVTLFYVCLFFSFSPFSYLIAGIPYNSVKHAATHILALGITPVGKLQHGFYKSKCSFNIFVGWFQCLKFIKCIMVRFYLIAARIFADVFLLLKTTYKFYAMCKVINIVLFFPDFHISKLYHGTKMSH